VIALPPAGKTHPVTVTLTITTLNLIADEHDNE
jgi:hypothetical protein